MRLPFVPEDKESKMPYRFTPTLLLACLALWSPARAAAAPDGPGAAASTAPAPSEGGGQGQLTVERIYTDPPLAGRLPAQVQFDPDGKYVTFLEAEGDEPPSLWQVDVQTGQRSALIPADRMPLREEEEEEGQEGREAAGEGAAEASRFRIDSYQWSPAGTQILILSSGELFVAEVETGDVRRLTETRENESDPKFSPDGKWVAFVRAHNLHAVPAAGGGQQALTREGSEEILLGEPDWVSCEELDLCSAYWWSPDSTRVALLRFDQSEVYRYPIADWLKVHADVDWEHYPKAGDANAGVALGVVGPGDGGPRWLETGAAPDDYLARVEWTADGDSLLVQILNRGQDRLRLVREDADGGPAEILLEETDEHWVNVTDDLRALEDGRLLWSSERDGWRHLYLYGHDGKLLRRLTEGSWMVTGVVGVDEQRGRVFFTATEKSYLERHLYRVGLDGKDLVRVTSAP
ncbi:MAG: DPP IV N-terminal domain-containing protein, partial [Nitrospinota bacterium]